MTNPLKGQMTVKIGSEEYTCRLTVDSLIKIENTLDKGIIQLTQRLSEADVRVNDIAVVLLHALRGGGNNVDDKAVKKIIQDNGIVPVCSAVAQLLVSTLSDTSAEEDGKKEGVTL